MNSFDKPGFEDRFNCLNDRFCREKRLNSRDEYGGLVVLLQEVIRVESAISDENLMTEVRESGCPESFSALVGRWQGPIYSLCFRMISCKTDAEDLTQDVFCNLFRKRDAYRVEAKFSTYLWQIAVNRCRDFLRQRKRLDDRQENYQQQFQPEGRDLTSQVDARDQIEHALNQLPSYYREVLVLKHFQGLSFKQIAQVADIPIGTAASRMNKGMELLKEILEKGVKP